MTVAKATTNAPVACEERLRVATVANATTNVLSSL